MKDIANKHLETMSANQQLNHFAKKISTKMT